MRTGGVRRIAFGLLLGIATAPLAGQATRPGDATLLGDWKVDLRPTPDAEPYYQAFVVDSIQDNAFWGSFYGTPIESGRLNRDWGELQFAFVTRDGSGAYHHSGRVRTGRLDGLTLSIGRAFLAVWTAERETSDGTPSGR